MKGILGIVAIVHLAAWTNHASAQSIIEAERTERGGPDAPVMWVLFTGLNSSRLAQEGAELLASTALDWPDGTKAIVTFWKPTQEPYIWANVVRCTDYFDNFMQSNGGGCSIPRVEE